MEHTTIATKRFRFPIKFIVTYAVRLIFLIFNSFYNDFHCWSILVSTFLHTFVNIILAAHEHFMNKLTIPV